MALKPWTGIPTACTHWFSLLPQEKNRRRDRHGDGLLRPPLGVFARPDHEDGLPNLCASRTVQPASLGQGMGKERGFCVCRFWCSRTSQNLPCPKDNGWARGFVAQSGMGSADPPRWQAACGFWMSCICALCGRTRKALHQALQGVLGKIYG